MGNGGRPITPEDEGKAGEHGDDLADNSAPGDAGDAEAEGDAEQDRHGDVDAVEQDLQRKTDGAQSASKYEAEQGEVRERHRGGENADADIGRSRRLHAAIRTHHRRTEADNGGGCEQDEEAEADGQDDRAPEDGEEFRRLAASLCLCDKCRG